MFACCQRMILLTFGLALTAPLAGNVTVAEAQQLTPHEAAREIANATGIQGGFVVHLSCGNGELTTALRLNERFQAHGLALESSHVVQARATVRRAGLYGDVAVDQLRGDRLPYVDNLVNLLVTDDLGEVPMSEVMRVLTPAGVAYVRQAGQWHKTVKRRPKNIDDWTHFCTMRAVIRWHMTMSWGLRGTCNGWVVLAGPDTTTGWRA